MYVCVCPQNEVSGGLTSRVYTCMAGKYKSSPGTGLCQVHILKSQRTTKLTVYKNIL